MILISFIPNCQKNNSEILKWCFRRFYFDIYTLRLIGNLQYALCGFVAGSGFYIEVALKYLNPSPIFSPVNHSRQNELDSFTGDKAVLESYCPYPMPVRHELYYKTHKVYYHWRLKMATIDQPVLKRVL